MNFALAQQRLAAAGFNPGVVDGIPGPKTFGAYIAYVGRPKDTALALELGKAAARWLPGAGIVTPLRIAHAFARWAVETGGFSKMEENLDYTARRLAEVWPSRYAIDPRAKAKLPNPIALSLEHNPEALANRTYGGRLGNSLPGDGWRHRGRGPTMLTGKSNYAEAAAITGLDLLADPDLVTRPDIGMRVACAYWLNRRINAAADRDDTAEVCRLVQGGSEGLADQRAYLARAKRILL